MSECVYESIKTKIFIEDKWDFLKSYNTSRDYYITDENLFALYSSRLPVERCVVVPQGEAAKTISSLSCVAEDLLGKGVDRSSRLIAFGGGVVTDLCGFLASMYMRGIPFVSVSTSLLGMVDAAVGGKTGINLNRYKNVLGSFYHAQAVHLAVPSLISLPDSEWINGFAEVLKYVFLGNSELQTLLDEQSFEDLQEHPHEMLRFCVQQKMAVVDYDEKETGQRRLLNLGHTLGHALEKVSTLCHGEAVALGLLFAARFSHSKGILSRQELLYIQNLLTKFRLPVQHDYEHERLLEAMHSDKKKEAETLHFIFLEAIGRAVAEPLGFPELKEALYELC